MGTVDPAYIDRLQEDIIIACHRLEQTGHESLVITVSEEGHLIFGSQKGKNFIEDKHVFIKDFVLHCQNSKTVVKVETELDENAEIIEDKELINTNSKPKKSLSIGERDLTHEETRDFTHKETGKDGTKTEKEKEGENNVFANLESSAGVETNMFDDDTDDYDDTEALSPVEAKLEAAADSAAVDELAGEESMNVDGDYTVVTVKEEQSEHEAEESSKGNSKRMSDAKVVLKRINMIINSNQSTKLRSKKLKVQKMGKKTKGKDTGTTACDICGKELSCSTAVNRHKICFHSDKKNHECEECGKKFKLPEGLMRHRTVHSAEKEFKCETCTKSFKRLEYLKSHMKTHDPVKPYNCAECGKSFMKKETLDNHERVHSGEKAIECKECDQQFSCKGKLDEHLKGNKHRDIKTQKVHECEVDCSHKVTVKEEVPNTENRSILNNAIASVKNTFQKIHHCKYCVYSTKDKSNFNKHMRIMHNCGGKSNSSFLTKKEHICDQCGKCLSSKYGLNLHIKNFHEHSFKHICPTCNKGFNQTIQFNFHCKRHFNIVADQCEFCGTQFTSHGSLPRHLKICKKNPEHEEVNGCVCPKCARVFPTERQLKEHFQGKHEPPAYKCSECGKLFSWRSSLKSHYKYSHPGYGFSVSAK